MKGFLLFSVFLLTASRSQGQIFLSLDAEGLVFVGGSNDYVARMWGNAIHPVFEMTTPPQTTFVSVTPPAGWTCQTPPPGGTGQISCTGPSFFLFLGAFVALPVRLKVDPAYEYFTALETTATLRADNAAPVTAESSQATTPLYDVGLDKSVVGQGGGALTFALKVTNAGPSFARNLLLVDDLPPSLGFLSVEASGWSCTTPSPGQSGQVRCTHPAFPLTEQTLLLSVSVLQPGEGINTARLENTAGIDFFQADNADTVTFGALLSDIPALDTAGLVLLALGLTGAAWLRIRRAWPKA